MREKERRERRREGGTEVRGGRGGGKEMRREGMRGRNMAKSYTKEQTVIKECRITYLIFRLLGRVLILYVDLQRTEPVQ